MKSEEALRALIQYGKPNGIEEEQLNEQNRIVNYDVLPKKIEDKSKQKLIEWGVEFLEDFDDLFVNVNLPEGWKKEKTENFYWTNVVDAQNCIRARCFYKAAIYDREAFCIVESNTED